MSWNEAFLNEPFTICQFWKELLCYYSSVYNAVNCWRNWMPYVLRSLLLKHMKDQTWLIFSLIVSSSRLSLKRFLPSSKSGDTKSPNIKEEIEEFCITQQGEKLQGLQEDYISPRFTSFTPLWRMKCLHSFIKDKPKRTAMQSLQSVIHLVRWPEQNLIHMTVKDQNHPGS